MLRMATGIRGSMLWGVKWLRAGQAGWWVLFPVGPGTPLERGDLSRTVRERRAGGRQLREGAQVEGMADARAGAVGPEPRWGQALNEGSSACPMGRFGGEK